MTPDPAWTLRSEVATVTLRGAADSESVHRITTMLDAFAHRPPRRLILDLSEVAHLSSAVLRCLVLAHQRLGPGTEIVVADAAPDVARALRMACFDRSVTLTGRLPH